MGGGGEGWVVFFDCHPKVWPRGMCSVRAQARSDEVVVRTALARTLLCCLRHWSRLRTVNPVDHGCFFLF